MGSSDGFFVGKSWNVRRWTDATVMITQQKAKNLPRHARPAADGHQVGLHIGNGQNSHNYGYFLIQLLPTIHNASNDHGDGYVHGTQIKIAIYVATPVCWRERCVGACAVPQWGSQLESRPKAA